MTPVEWTLAILSGIFIPVLFFYLQRKREKLKEVENEIKLSPYIFGNSISDLRTTNLVYGIDNKLNSKDIIYCTFPISIGNSGTKTISSINVTFNYVSKSIIAVDNNALEFDTMFEKNHIIRKTIRSNETINTNFGIKYIHPKTSVQLKIIHLLNQETTLNFELPIEGKKLLVKSEVAHTFDVIISAENMVTKNYSFNLRVIKASSLKELINKTIDDIKKNKEKENNELFSNNFKDVKSHKIEDIENALSGEIHYFYATLTNKMKIKKIKHYLSDISKKDYQLIALEPKKSNR